MEDDQCSSESIQQCFQVRGVAPGSTSPSDWLSAFGGAAVGSTGGGVRAPGTLIGGWLWRAENGAREHGGGGDQHNEVVGRKGQTDGQKSSIKKEHIYIQCKRHFLHDTCFFSSRS